VLSGLHRPLDSTGILEELVTHTGKRLRLCPPYREHLAQAFARFFMRVGLPQDVQLPL